MGHMALSAAVFVILFTLGWVIAVCLNHLNTIHGFLPQVYTLVERLEIWLFYLDCVLSGYLVVFTCVNFLIYTLESET